MATLRSKIAIIRDEANEVISKIEQDAEDAIKIADETRTNVLKKYNVHKRTLKDTVVKRVEHASYAANEYITDLNRQKELAKLQKRPDYESVRKQLDAEYLRTIKEQADAKEKYDAEYLLHRAGLDQWMRDATSEIENSIKQIRLKMEADIHNVRCRYRRQEVADILHAIRLAEYDEPANVDANLRDKMTKFGDVFCVGDEYIVMKRVKTDLQDALLSKDMFDTLKKVANVRLAHGLRHKVVFSVVGGDEFRADFVAFPECKWIAVLNGSIPDSLMFPSSVKSTTTAPFSVYVIINTIAEVVLNETCKDLRDDSIESGYMMTSVPAFWTKKRKRTNKLEELSKEAHGYIEMCNRLKKHRDDAL